MRLAAKHADDLIFTANNLKNYAMVQAIQDTISYLIEVITILSSFGRGHGFTWLVASTSANANQTLTPQQRQASNKDMNHHQTNRPIKI